MKHQATKLLAVVQRRTARLDLANWIVPALILITPLVNFLRYQDYGLLRPESLLCVGILAGLGLVVGALGALGPSIIRPALVGLLLVLFIDVQFPWVHYVRSAMVGHGHDPGSLGRLVFALVLFGWLFLSVVLRLLGKNMGTVLVSVFGVALAATLLLPAGGAAMRGFDERITSDATVDAVSGSDLPIILHLVLDEQIGAEGLPKDVPGAALLHAELRAFYEDRGFRLFGRAFSKYERTENSLGSLLNGQAPAEDLAFVTPPGPSNSVPQHTLLQNSWFSRLAQKGYRIRVYESDHLDFCAQHRPAIESCDVYSASGVQRLRSLELGLADKAELLFEHLLHGAWSYRLFSWLYADVRRAELLRDGQERTAAQSWGPHALSPLAALPVADRLIADLRQARPGTVYFAHLLLPHYSYLLDPDCKPRPDLSTWYAFAGLAAVPPARHSRFSRSQSYIAYFDQVRCSQRKVGQMLDALGEAAARDDSIVILHGDHGSRIARHLVLDSRADLVRDGDFIDSFSTLFAIRSPEIPAGYDRSLRSIQALFAELALHRPFREVRAEVYATPARRGAGVPLQTRPMVDFAW